MNIEHPLACTLPCSSNLTPRELGRCAKSTAEH